MLAIPEFGHPWYQLRTHYPDIEELGITVQASGEIRWLWFYHDGQLYRLCDWVGSQPQPINEEDVPTRLREL